MPSDATPFRHGTRRFSHFTRRSVGSAQFRGFSGRRLSARLSFCHQPGRLIAVTTLMLRHQVARRFIECLNANTHLSLPNFS